MKKAMTFGILVAAFLLHGAAYGQEQDKAQQKCINALNKGMLKVASAQNKANAKCAFEFAKGKNMSAVACWTDPAKVTTAETKNCEAETKKCTTAPDFGKTSCGNVNNYSEFNASELPRDLFSQANPDTGITLCANDKPACKCQAKTLKAANKLYATYMKNYNKCKKTGLKHKTTPIIDMAGLAACMDVDLKMKIQKAATKLDGAIAKKCAAVPSPFPAVDSDCVALTGTALGDCIEDRVRCRVCVTTEASDGLSVNCDFYDDGDTENNSCFDDF